MKVSPFHVVAANADTKIKQGWKVYQQFNCAACGAKQTMPDENKFYTHGRCEECGHVSDLEADGCNFMATISVP